MAMRAGKHVLVEKPVASGVDEIHAMQDCAAAAGVVCMPSHNYVYEPPLQRTRAMIDAGSLGTILAVYIMYNIHHPEAVCARLPGIIRQIGTHHAYTARYLLQGQPRAVSAFRATLRDEDTGTAPQENLATMTLQMTSVRAQRTEHYGWDRCTAAAQLTKLCCLPPPSCRGPLHTCK